MTRIPTLNEQLQILHKECSRLRDEKLSAQERIAELEQENLEFASQLVRYEETNSNLTSLYTVLSRLHSTYDRDEIFTIISEVVIDFVGAEKFALFLFDEHSSELRYKTGEGFYDMEKVPIIKAGQGVLGQVMLTGEDYINNDFFRDGSDDVCVPLVAIALKTRHQKVGVLALYQWLVPKERLETIDYQLFSMLGEHAALAIFYSFLYAQSERKRQTYQGVLDLLIK